MKALNLPKWCYKVREVVDKKQLTVEVQITKLGRIYLYVVGFIFYIKQYFKK